MKIATNHTWHNIRQYEKKIHLTSKICADPQLFFLLINPQYMYGIRVNSSAVDSPNNSLIKNRKENKVTKDFKSDTPGYFVIRLGKSI